MPKQAAVSLVAVFTKHHLHTEFNAVCDENRSLEKLSWLGEKAEMLRCHIAKIWLNVSVRRPTKWGCARTVSSRCAIMPLPTEKGKTKGKTSNPMFFVTKTMSARVIVFFLLMERLSRSDIFASTTKGNVTFTKSRITLFSCRSSCDG